MRAWKPTRTHSPDSRRITGTRPVSCCGCGESAVHFEALWLPELELFSVPYVGLNGGVGEEIGDEEMDDLMGPRERVVFLSDCCHVPRWKNGVRGD